jgi:hypothetical protein
MVEVGVLLHPLPYIRAGQRKRGKVLGEKTRLLDDQPCSMFTCLLGLCEQEFCRVPWVLPWPQWLSAPTSAPVSFFGLLPPLQSQRPFPGRTSTGPKSPHTNSRPWQIFLLPLPSFDGPVETKSLATSFSVVHGTLQGITWSPGVLKDVMPTDMIILSFWTVN